MMPGLIKLSDDAEFAHYLALMEYLILQTGYEERGDAARMDKPAVIKSKRLEFIQIGHKLGLKRSYNLTKLTGLDRYIAEVCKAERDPDGGKLLRLMWPDIMRE